MSKYLNFVIVKLTPIGAFLSPLSITFINYFIYGLEDESYQINTVMYVKILCLRKNVNSTNVNFIFRLPFDYRTPFGYILYILFNATGAVCVAFALLPTICLTIGSCLLLISMANDIKNDLKLLNATGKKAKRGHVVMKKRFRQTIRVYRDLKEFSLILLLYGLQISSMCQ